MSVYVYKSAYKFRQKTTSTSIFLLVHPSIFVDLTPLSRLMCVQYIGKPVQNNTQ